MERELSRWTVNTVLTTEMIMSSVLGVCIGLRAG